MIGREYLQEMVSKGYKFTEERIVFITKDSEKKLVWLERGNDSAGLQHIINNHKEHFEEAFGIKEDEIALYLYKVITDGKLIDSKPSNIAGGFDRLYEYDNQYYTFVAMGNNGFIVTSFPNPK